MVLRSEVGRSQTERFTRGAVQMGLLLEDMDQIWIPRFSSRLESSIVERVSIARVALDEARAKIDGAAFQITATLGLNEWQPPEPLTYTRQAKKVFAAKRLDSVFFSPRVLELIELLSKDGLTVRDVAPPRCEQFVPIGADEFDYIEISDVRNDGTVTSSRMPRSEAPSRATWHVHSGDVLTSTVRPNRRLSALIMPEQDGFVCSSGFVVLQPQAIAPEVLLTYLRLPLFCELMDLHTSASMYPAISETDLLRLPFPKIPDNACRVITAAVQSAHTAREQATSLLDSAKRAVEIAIEKSEAEALAFLRDTTA